MKTTTSKNVRIILTLVLFYFVKPLWGQYNFLLTEYDTITTIGGIGYYDDKGVNGWEAKFEGNAATSAELSRPHFTMADSSGNYYIADKDAHAIRKIDTDGNITTVAGTNVSGYNGDGLGTETQLNAPNGIWVKPDGTVFILDLNNNKIRKLDLEGQIITIVDDTNGIAMGRGLWVSSDENLIYYANNSTIKKWTPTEGITTYASGFSSLCNIVVSPKGKLIATDRVGNRVYSINSEGSKEVIAGNGTTTGGGDGHNATETAFSGVRGVWFLDDTSYFLATHEGSQVWYIDNTGISHLFIDGVSDDDVHFGDGKHWNNSGVKISEARAVYVDYDGNVIITENDRGFIRKVQKTTEIINQIKKTHKPEYFDIYPNPVTDHIYLKLNSRESGDIKIKIFNSTGKVVFEQTEEYSGLGNEIRIDFDSKGSSILYNGIYYMIVHCGGKVYCSRFVKM